MQQSSGQIGQSTQLTTRSFSTKWASVAKPVEWIHLLDTEVRSFTAVYIYIPQWKMDPWSTDQNEKDRMGATLFYYHMNWPQHVNGSMAERKI